MPEGLGYNPSEVGKSEKYDQSYWTPDQIASTVTNFFEKLEHNEERIRAESQRLLQEALKNEDAIKKATDAIRKNEMAQAEEQRRSEYENELQETEAKRLFRGTIEWMIEQGPEQAQDLAILFLQQAPQDVAETTTNENGMI